jgi:hypothetical protein
MLLPKVVPYKYLRMPFLFKILCYICSCLCSVLRIDSWTVPTSTRLPMFALCPAAWGCQQSVYQCDGGWTGARSSRPRPPQRRETRPRPLENCESHMYMQYILLILNLYGSTFVSNHTETCIFAKNCYAFLNIEHILLLSVKFRWYIIYLIIQCYNSYSSVCLT